MKCDVINENFEQLYLCNGATNFIDVIQFFHLFLMLFPTVQLNWKSVEFYFLQTGQGWRHQPRDNETTPEMAPGDFRILLSSGTQIQHKI